MAHTASRRSTADSICIIGAGPSGIAAAKYLLAEKIFSRLVIFEQRENTGGVWNYTPQKNEPSAPPGFPIPQTDYSYRGNGDPSASHADPAHRPDLTTPIYDDLETNIPLGLLGFSDQDWPDGTPLFPRHEQVLSYLEKHSDEVRHLVRFGIEVIDVRLDVDTRWVVTTRSLSSPPHALQTDTFDAVIVASGHYAIPFLPATKGIEEWNAAHPGHISHSMFFRRAESYAEQKVLVIGNAASGSDIGRQIAEHCAPPLIFSSRSESFFFADDPVKYDNRPEIASFDPETRGVTFVDGSTITDIDRVLYCTGYMYSFPFLESLQTTPAPLIGTGERVQNLYQHIFYRPQPTLVFLGLPQKVIPFPFAEAQSALVAKVLAGKLELPSDAEMAAWEESVIADRGDGRKFHLFKFPEDAKHINMLHDWAQSGGPQGKEPPYWSEKQYWIRENFSSIRQAYLQYGAERGKNHTLENVGYDFEKWKTGEAKVEPVK